MILRWSTMLPLIFTRECQHPEWIFWRNFLQTLTKYVKQKEFAGIRQWPAQHSHFYQEEYKGPEGSHGPDPLHKGCWVCDAEKSTIGSLSWGGGDLSSRKLKGLEECLESAVPERKEPWGESIPEMCVGLPIYMSICTCTHWKSIGKNFLGKTIEIYKAISHT